MAYQIRFLQIKWSPCWIRLQRNLFFRVMLFVRGFIYSMFSGLNIIVGLLKYSVFSRMMPVQMQISRRRAHLPNQFYKHFNMCIFGQVNLTPYLTNATDLIDSQSSTGLQFPLPLLFTLIENKSYCPSIKQSNFFFFFLEAFVEI